MPDRKMPNSTNGNGHTLSWGAPGTAGATIAAGLVFENVSHDYDGVTSVQDLSLSIAPGEILCLLGHSGCGKTTLMRYERRSTHYKPS